MQVFPQTGEAGLTVKYSGDVLDSAIGIDTDLLQPPTRFYVHFTSGTANLVKGVRLTGQTSAATLLVHSVVVTSGTLAGNDGSGILFIKEVTGTISAGENLRVSTTTYCVTNTAKLDCQFENVMAKAIFVTIESNALRINWSTMSPTNAAATPASFGHLISNGQNIEIVGIQNAKNFKMINAVSTSNGSATVTIKF